MNPLNKINKKNSFRKGRRLRNRAFVCVKDSFFKRLRGNRRALSPVVSSMILIAVVIVMGFTTLVYAQSMSSNYQTEYHESMSSDINRLKETLAFEYCYYNSTSGGCVHAYLINAGGIEATVDKVYLSTSSNEVTYYVRYLNDTQAPNKTLSIGEERQIAIPLSLSSGSFTIKITTVRGSIFAYTFSV